MLVVLSRASAEDIPRVASLLNDYIHEMSAFMDGGVLSTEQQAAAYAMLTAYWKLDDHHPFLINYNGELVGLSFVRRYPGNKKLYDMGQFFVIDKVKRQGVGREAFRQTLANFPGEWLTRVLVSNERAFTFWKRVIAEVTRNDFLLTVESEQNTPLHFIRFRTECG